MSTDCKSFLRKNIHRKPTDEDLKIFFENFGENMSLLTRLILTDYSIQGGMLARTVWLGGSFCNWKTVESSGDQQIRKTKTSVESQISATFGAPFVSSSLGGQYSKGQEFEVDVKESGEHSKSSVYAQGGSTFLAEKYVYQISIH
jgi:hypothetical protein